MSENNETHPVSSAHSSNNPISVIGSYLTMIKFNPEGKFINFSNAMYLMGRTIKQDAGVLASNRAKKIRRNMRRMTCPK